MKGIGIDLCSVERMEGMMNERFLGRYYTAEEREYLSGRGTMACESAAAMFAAKEAFLKAAGVGIGRGIELSEIGVGHTEYGAPVYMLGENADKRLREMGASQAFLSLTHEGGMAAAVCVIE